ncbi:tripartite motif-containing protein 16-like protein isoform X2 [Acipenser ruthenus]|uniref:tripartite motif-containing protein 16-like protein isoform X2 n=1 Tax=Acipenser ruthenus TaxID=7906 RepID=UPI0027415D72|nr:tripartite motif-containing protein 16-like protein isoform X2 [Acipenser ruthenus]
MGRDIPYIMLLLVVFELKGIECTRAGVLNPGPGDLLSWWGFSTLVLETYCPGGGSQPWSWRPTVLVGVLKPGPGDPLSWWGFSTLVLETHYPGGGSQPWSWRPTVLVGVLNPGPGDPLSWWGLSTLVLETHYPGGFCSNPSSWKQLRETQAELQQRILERLKELGELKQAVHLLKSTAQTEIKESKMIFTALIRSIKRVRAEVLVLIEANEKASVNQAEGLIKRLEQEIDALRRRNAELKQLSETEDHIHFLQNFQALCAPPVTGDLPSVTVNPNISSGTMRKVVAELKEHIEDFCKGELSKMTKTVNEVAVYSLQDPEPRTRAEFLKYSRHLTLDPNTAHRKLHLSDGNRKVTRSTQAQRYPDHPERFDRWTQVLCRESLSGTRCYWEVEWSGGDAFIGVTYKGINRKGGQYACVLGRNDISCSLYCSDSIYTARHNNKKIEIIAPYRRRIGVYLDFTAASLSFYGVSGDSMMFLHTFQTTFTEPLYPGFWLPCVNSSVTICKLN